MTPVSRLRIVLVVVASLAAPEPGIADGGIWGASPFSRGEMGSVALSASEMARVTGMAI